MTETGGAPVIYGPQGIGGWLLLPLLHLLLFIGGNVLELFRMFSDGKTLSGLIAGSGAFGMAVING